MIKYTKDGKVRLIDYPGCDDYVLIKYPPANSQRGIKVELKTNRYKSGRTIAKKNYYKGDAWLKRINKAAGDYALGKIDVQQFEAVIYRKSEDHERLSRLYDDLCEVRAQRQQYRLQRPVRPRTHQCFTVRYPVEELRNLEVMRVIRSAELAALQLGYAAIAWDASRAKSPTVKPMTVFSLVVSALLQLTLPRNMLEDRKQERRMIKRVVSGVSSDPAVVGGLVQVSHHIFKRATARAVTKNNNVSFACLDSINDFDLQNGLAGVLALMVVIPALYLNGGDLQPWQMVMGAQVIISALHAGASAVVHNMARRAVPIEHEDSALVVPAFISRAGS